MRLAMQLGRTVEELNATMPADEYSDWVSLYMDEPFGDTRADLRAGVIANAFVRVMSKTKTTPLDFMPIIKKLREREMEAEGATRRIIEMRQTFEGNLSKAVRRTKISRRH